MKSNLELMQNVVKPYIDAKNQALTNYVTENNVKNLLPVSLSALKSLNAGGSWNGNVCTIGGITFTVNDDLSITLNETSTATVTFTLYNGTNPTDYNGKILSGFTGGSGGTGIRISDTIATSVYNYSDDTLITGLTATNQVAVIIRIDSGKTFTNQLVTPMIRDASITDPTYQPYAKTNVELTQNVTVSTDNAGTGLDVKRYGKVVTINIEGEWTVTQNQFTALGVLHEGFRPSVDIWGVLMTGEANMNALEIRVRPSGSIEANGWQLSGTLTLRGSVTYITP